MNAFVWEKNDDLVLLSSNKTFKKNKLHIIVYRKYVHNHGIIRMYMQYSK